MQGVLGGETRGALTGGKQTVSSPGGQKRYRRKPNLRGRGKKIESGTLEKRKEVSGEVVAAEKGQEKKRAHGGEGGRTI